MAIRSGSTSNFLLGDNLRSTWGTAAPHNGSYAYAISNHTYGYLDSGLIDIQPNMQYDLYAYVRGEIDGDDSAGSWIIRAYYCDSNGNYIGYYQDAASGGAGSLTNSWQYKGGRITTPANAAKLRIQLYDYMNSGWVAFDDIYLRKVEIYNLVYDAENHLVSVSGGTSATFYYDGDGNRVKGTIGGITTTYIGNPSVPSGQGYFEWTGSPNSMKKYYYAGASRVAMRTGSSTIEYLLSDHLGSQAITANSSGVMSAEIRYFPWGTERYTSGSTPTTFRFTGQRNESGIGLYYYGARWYDAALGRWVQPDTVIPEQTQGVQAWDRYAYSSGNPVKYIDPTGHSISLPLVNIDPCRLNPEFCQEFLNDEYFTQDEESNNDILDQTSNVEYSFPNQPDYQSVSIYFGQFGSLLELLFAQLEPTPFAELLSPVAGQWLSGGVTITKDKYGRIFISPGAAFGRTLISYPLLGLPAMSYTYGYIERGESLGPDGNATRQELDQLLSSTGRSHGFCGPIFPCINRVYSLTTSASAWEWGFGIPQINIFSIFFGFKP